jgi:hypothetical protein
MPQKQRINTRLQLIANALLMNASFINNLGLLNGKMGIAIFFFQYGRYTNKEVYTIYANELIDEIYEELNTQMPDDFANGLTGIGWGIEYLVRNDFVEANTDEALEDIDQFIYKNKQDRPMNFENSNDLFSFGFYYLKRLYGRENEDNLNILLKKQQLIFLTDECERLLIHKRLLHINIPVLNLTTLNSITYFLIEMIKLGLSPSKVENLVNCLPSYFEYSIHQENDWAEKTTSLKLIRNIQSIVSISEVLQHYASLEKKITVSYSGVMDEAMVNSFVKSAWHHLVYEPYRNGNSDMTNLTEKVLTLIDKEEDWINRMDSLNANNMGLTGFAGIGLGLMNEVILNSSII